MTTLKKLGLRGVRSYSQSTEETIEFFKPLTIIVGANGAGPHQTREEEGTRMRARRTCLLTRLPFSLSVALCLARSHSGKTTIIEALKFVTTGTLPPLSDGGKSFVHDPKMDGTALVKAQVKLSFVTGGSDPKTVLAIRNFQLAQRKTKREFKGMEAVLQTKDEQGRESSVSHSQTNDITHQTPGSDGRLELPVGARLTCSSSPVCCLFSPCPFSWSECADMEKLVPQLMGVSPAVLENVIFCHQEDSLWPLSDGKTLKTKFDDIFAATRYTKALENIAKLRKEKATEIKIMEVERAHDRGGEERRAARSLAGPLTFARVTFFAPLFSPSFRRS